MLRLRPYKACDAKTIVSWVKDETAFHKWSADRFERYPITQEDLNAHYDALAYTDQFFEMTAYDEMETVGHLIMRFTDERKNILRFGFVIVDDTKRGMGYGKELLQLAILYAFSLLKVDTITLGVFENNPPAYYCYKSVGFRETGEVVDYMIAGETWKCIELELKKSWVC